MRFGSSIYCFRPGSVFIPVMQGRATNPDGIHAELARRNSDRPEQDAWSSQASKHLAAVAFHDSTRVHTYE
jgi:hypothetical protein